MNHPFPILSGNAVAGRDYFYIISYTKAKNIFYATEAQ